MWENLVYTRVMETNTTVLGELIRKRRLQLELTTGEVARAIGCSPGPGSFVTMLEKGRRKLDPEDAPKMAGVLRLDPVQLTKLALFEKHPATYRTLFGNTPPPGISLEEYAQPQSTWDQMRQLYETLPERSQSYVQFMMSELAGSSVQ